MSQFIDELHAIDPDKKNDRERLQREAQAADRIIACIKRQAREITQSGAPHVIQGFWNEHIHEGEIVPSRLYNTSFFTEEEYSIGRFRDLLREKVYGLGFTNSVVDTYMISKGVLQAGSFAGRLRAVFSTKVENVYILRFDIRW